MLRLIILVLLLIPTSVFAGKDTDRICSDNSKIGLIEESIEVSYPGETPFVQNVGKVFYRINPQEATMDVQGYFSLYYIVNIGESSNRRAEFYQYNCSTKKPRLLLNINMNPNISEDTYMLQFIGNTTLVITGHSPGMGIGPIETIIGYDYYANKKLFTYTDSNNLMKEGVIRGFATGKNAWYLFFAPSAVSGIKNAANEKVYKIDKKSKKISEL